MSANWEARWSRRGQIAAQMSRPARDAPPEMISFVYGDPDADSLPLEDMAEAAEYLAENNQRGTLAYANPVGPDGLASALADKIQRDYDIALDPEQILL